MTRKIGNRMKEVCFVLLVELSFEGSRVEWRTLAIAIIFIIDVHDKVVVQQEAC